MNDLNFSIVISTRNSAPYIKKCLDSAIFQKHPNYEIIFIDAQSDDGTYEIAKQYQNKTNNIKILQNETRKYQGENIKIGTEISRPNSIIVTLDGDDWFPHDQVLSRVQEEYQKKDCWMTYGRYIESPYRDVSALYQEYPLEIRRNKLFRKYNWQATHLRTFKRELFLKIKEQDLKDPKTQDYFSNVCDLSFQFPMLEMCGVDKSAFIPDILYVYNVENPLSDGKKDRSEPNRMEAYIRNQTPYETIESL